MSELLKIGKRLIVNNQDPTEEVNSKGSFFKDPVSGALNYHSFSDFSTKLELVEVLKTYLGEYDFSEDDFESMAMEAFKLREKRDGGGDQGDLSEFVYIMH